MKIKRKMNLHQFEINGRYILNIATEGNKSRTKDLDPKNVTRAEVIVKLFKAIC